MNIYFIRHGIANDNFNDNLRELSSEGKEIIFESAKNWKSMGIKFDYIFSSPLIRARQTAELIKTAMEYDEEIINEPALAPGSRTESIITLANSFPESDIAVVGHQPDLGEHVSSMVSNSGVNIRFSPGTICRVSFLNGARYSAGSLDLILPALK